MNAAPTALEPPPTLEATVPPEDRGVGRDGVRLLVTTGRGSEHHGFRELPELLRPGDLLVVNDSETVAASLPARGPAGEFLLNLSTSYGDGIWLAEPRWGPARPGPLPIAQGSVFRAGGVPFRAVHPYPGIERLWFVRADDDVDDAMRRFGQPIRYGYVPRAYPLSRYQTVFARVPGSSEMPSAARPFTPAILDRLGANGVRVVSVTLHTGVSSLEAEPDASGIPPVYPEPFDVPAQTADAVGRVRCAGGRVIAVGTTVLRSLETAWDGSRVRPARGFTRLVLGPDRPIRSVDGLLTGFHAPRTSHLALLFGFGGARRITAAYHEAVRARYLWHEFGDSHLIWAPRAG
jgi:S-adenosylmethionine:tRNA ribosyltransferase-isomerase